MVRKVIWIKKKKLVSIAGEILYKEQGKRKRKRSTGDWSPGTINHMATPLKAVSVTCHEKYLHDQAYHLSPNLRTLKLIAESFPRSWIKVKEWYRSILGLWPYLPGIEQFLPNSSTVQKTCPSRPGLAIDCSFFTASSSLSHRAPIYLFPYLSNQTLNLLS